MIDIILLIVAVLTLIFAAIAAYPVFNDRCEKLTKLSRRCNIVKTNMDNVPESHRANTHFYTDDISDLIKNYNLFELDDIWNDNRNANCYKRVSLIVKELNTKLKYRLFIKEERNE
jgi:hypothetical protein